MRSFNRIVKAAVLIAAVLIVFLALDFVLYPCTFMRNDIHSIVTETFDDVYMGTSHGKMNIDPDTIEEITGRSGHNVCVGGEYPADTYYMLRLMLEKGHKPKRVVYEISPGYLVRQKEEGNNYLLFYHEFPLSRTKLAYFMDTVSKCNLRTLFFPWYEYPLSYELSKVKETCSVKLSRDYSASLFKTQAQEYHESGFIARFPVDTSTLTTDGLTAPQVTDIVPENMAYLEKLVSLCKKEEIDFLAVTTPLPLENLQAFAAEYQQMWQMFDAWFAQQGVPYINYNGQEHFNDFTHDRMAFTDMDGHLNSEAAVAYSRVLAGQLGT